MQKSGFNSLPNVKVLDWSKLKAFPDNRPNVTQKLNFDFQMEENIVGKGENAGYQHFFLSHYVFKRLKPWLITPNKSSH